MMRPPARRVRSRSKVATAILSALMIVLGTVVATPAAATPPVASDIVRTADLSKFQPGNIVSDSVFYDGNAMTEAQIQAFLNSKVTTCRSGYVCLKDKTDTTRAIAADAMCKAYAGGGVESAARIIFKVGQACGINPKALIVMLQKEQGLVTDTYPYDSQYKIAMGQGCPDTAACDSRYFGFFNQVYGAAWQLKRYGNPPGTSNYFTWYAPGKTWNVRYHPNVSCGTSPVYIANQATSALYYYTPYQPNAAALRAGYGEGDGCSAYGNRNFYQYFTDWFGSTQVRPNACAAPPVADILPADGERTVNTGTLNLRLAPSTDCEQGRIQLGQGRVVSATGVYGDWTRVRVDGAVYWASTQYLAVTPAAAYGVDRIQGADRIMTAVEMSKRGFPDGAGVLFIASGADFPDALTASSAAAAQGASLLITGHAGLPAEAWQEVRRLNPSRVVVLGGTAAVNDGVMNELRSALPSARVERVGGANRFETSRLVAGQLMTTSPTVYVATGLNYPDALSAAGAGAAREAAVLLIDGRDRVVDAATLATLSRLGAKTVVIVGGEHVVPATIADSLRAAGIAVERLGGADRYITNLTVNAHVYPGSFANAFLATGQNFPDAVVGAVLSARKDGPLLLASAGCMTGASKDYLLKAGVRQVTLLGGPDALSEAVFRSTRC